MKSKSPGNILTVVIRNDAPMVCCGDSPSYRSVRIKLTPEQLQSLRLEQTHGSEPNGFHEVVSRCFIEQSEPDSE